MSDNAKKLYHGDFEFYRSTREPAPVEDPNNCQIAESENFLGAQQCKFSWECRGARTCERGGWCNGWDSCYQTPQPDQAPGLLPDC